MKQKSPRSADSVRRGTSPEESGRRKFLKDSLGAAPVVLTIGNRSGWGGGSMHGTLWSSAGTNWRHRGDRWWRRGDWKEWDEPKPPRWSDHRDRPKGEPQDEEHRDTRDRNWEWGGDSPGFRSDSYRNSEADWEWYRDKERRRSGSTKGAEKRVNPLEPSKRSDR